MWQQPSPPKQQQYKSSRPFLSFLKSSSSSSSSSSTLNARRTEWSVPPPYGPPPPRPDTACSILADADGRDTPVKQYPPVTFAPSPSTRSATHSRNASTPVAPQSTPPPLRARSGTVENSSYTFGTPEPETQGPRVIARDYGLSPRPPPAPFALEVGGRYKKRPSPLRLQTTNLEHMPPSPAAITPSEPTPTPVPSGRTPGSKTDILSSTSQLERRRSRSTGDLAGAVIPPTPSHRPSRSESSTQVFHGHPDAKREEQVCTPASSMLSTPASEKTITAPSVARVASGARFENVALPWSTQPLVDLLPDLPRRYLPHILAQLLDTSPVVLSPDKLASLSSEQARLGLELDRLKVKHTKLSQYRDKLLLRTFSTGGGGKEVETLQSAIARVDRVARQIYICNDQLRQMEVLKRDHEVGVLLWALQERAGRPSGGHEVQPVTQSAYHSGEVEAASASELAYGRQSLEFDKKVQAEAEKTGPGIQIQVTRATVFGPNLDPAPEVEAVEVLASPADEHEHELELSTPTGTDYRGMERERQVEKERPVSTISIALSPTNLGGFPLPPARVIPSHTLQFDRNCISIGRELEVPKTPHSIVSCSSKGDEGGDERITILSPDHDSPTALDGIEAEFDWPHTPLPSEHDHLSSSSSFSSSAAAAGPAVQVPLRARRSRPELSVYVPAPPSRLNNSLSVVQPRRAVRIGDVQSHKQSKLRGTGTTSPLRVSKNEKIKAKSQSLAFHGSEQGQGLGQGQRRFRRGRESCLETPGSILLSLATAELWTKEVMISH